MSDQQMAELYERLTQGKKKESKWPFLRGWNAAIDFAIKQMRRVCEDDDDRAA